MENLIVLNWQFVHIDEVQGSANEHIFASFNCWCTWMCILIWVKGATIIIVMIILMELLKFTDLLSGCASFSCKYIVHYLVYRGIKVVSVSLPMLIIIL